MRTKAAIRSMDGCAALPAYRPALISNKRWPGYCKNAT